MKFIGLLFVAMLILSSFATAQTPIERAKGFFERASDTELSHAQKTADGELDANPIFLARTSCQFCRKGETVTVDLIALRDFPEGVWGYWRLLRPGNKYRFDNETSRTTIGAIIGQAGDRGILRSIKADRVYRQQVSTLLTDDTDTNDGEYQLQLVLVRMQGDQRAQYINIVFFLNFAPSEGLSSEQRYTATEDGGKIVVYGDFQLGVNYIVGIGILDGFFVVTRAQTVDGKTLRVGRPQSGLPMALDLVVNSYGWHYTRPGAIILVKPD